MAVEVDTETKGKTGGLQRGRNVLSGKANLITVAPGEGQEVIIKSFGCRDSDGNPDHRRWDASPPPPTPTPPPPPGGAGRAEGEWRVDRIGYCFQTHARAHIPLLMDGQICILMPESAPIK